MHRILKRLLTRDFGRSTVEGAVANIYGALILMPGLSTAFRGILNNALDWCITSCLRSPASKEATNDHQFVAGDRGRHKSHVL